MLADSPKLTVVIPSLDGHRDGAVRRLLESLDHQTYTNFEVELVTGVSPQGEAINQGVRAGSGEVVVIIDDDAELADATVLESLVATLHSDPSIGMAGASIVLHPEASPFQRRAARQFPRLCTPRVDEITDSDLACHGCCAIPRKVFDETGGERTDIVRGLDPDLRQRLRGAGYRVVLAPNACVYHPLPNNWQGLIRTFFRNGHGSAYAQKFRPELVFDTDERLGSEGFRAKRPLWFRAGRFPLRLLRALFTGQLQRFVAYGAYFCGYVWGWLTARPLPAVSQSRPAQ